MKKHSPLKDTGVKKYYILTRPAKLSDLSFDELETDDNANWHEKSRQMQARRWRKIRHQVV